MNGQKEHQKAFCLSWTKVTASPSQRQSVSSLESGATAGSEHQSREQSTNHSSAQLSSCRPTEDDSRWNLSKPGVLMSTAGFADVTGETNEVAPLSRVPELEISDDESSNAPSPGSSKLPAVSRSKGSPISQEVKTTSTSKKVGLRISPKKSPEENEEPRGVSSSAYSRPLNASLSQEPEENSFEISRYRVDFNESPSVILMAKNNVPINNVPIKSTRDTPRSMETIDRVASQEEEKLGKSSLHDPLVITLSAAVVCLSLYIIWLKHKN
uniref:Uncharacterized protein n=1 Tax=Pyxicephalus adspersus TaxID=30357 RepID=A0AAV3AVC3_PYXAD|nr:TPA: hypothetical protein GDO54_009687 [Pyxicephalus adspersus]